VNITTTEISERPGKFKPLVSPKIAAGAIIHKRPLTASSSRTVIKQAKLKDISFAKITNQPRNNGIEPLQLEGRRLTGMTAVQSWKDLKAVRPFTSPVQNQSPSALMMENNEREQIHFTAPNYISPKPHDSPIIKPLSSRGYFHSQIHQIPRVKYMLSQQKEKSNSERNINIIHHYSSNQMYSEPALHGRKKEMSTQTIEDVAAPQLSNIVVDAKYFDSYTVGVQSFDRPQTSKSVVVVNSWVTKDKNPGLLQANTSSRQIKHSANGSFV